MEEKRITIQDYPRERKSPTQRSPQAIQLYDAFHATSVLMGWVFGEHPAINWCERHGKATEVSGGKSWCTDCGAEAETHMLSLKVFPDPPQGRERKVPNPRRGDITGRERGRPPSTRRFNGRTSIPASTEITIYRS